MQGHVPGDLSPLHLGEGPSGDLAGRLGMPANHEPLGDYRKELTVGLLLLYDFFPGCRMLPYGI